MKEVTDIELISIYKERKKECIRLLEEGRSYEEMREIIDKMDFQERIEEMFPVKKNEGYKIGDVLALYEIVGSKKEYTKINGKQTYCRYFIKKCGYAIYLGNGYMEYIFIRDDIENSVGIVGRVGNIFDGFNLDDIFN